MAILTVADTEWEAETIAAAMKERGIPAMVEGGYVAGWRAETPGKARVMVFQSDLERARAAARDAAFTGASIDWDAVEVGEPETPLPGPPSAGDWTWKRVGLIVVIVALAALAWGLVRSYGAHGR